jgi:hypothetical protein
MVDRGHVVREDGPASGQQRRRDEEHESQGGDRCARRRAPIGRARAGHQAPERRGECRQPGDEREIDVHDEAAPEEVGPVHEAIEAWNAAENERQRESSGKHERGDRDDQPLPSGR